MRTFMITAIIFWIDYMHNATTISLERNWINESLTDKTNQIH